MDRTILILCVHFCIDMEVVSRSSTRSAEPGTKKSKETQAKDVTDDGMCM